MRKALQARDIKRINTEAEKIIDSALEKKVLGGRTYGGEGSLEHAVTLSKVTKEIEPNVTYVFLKNTDSREIFSLLRQYSEEGIRATKKSLGKDADLSGMLAAQYYRAARVCNGELNYNKGLENYAKARIIYENIYSIKEKNSALNSGFLYEMSNFYSGYGAIVEYLRNHTEDTASLSPSNKRVIEDKSDTNLGNRLYRRIMDIGDITVKEQFKK